MVGSKFRLGSNVRKPFPKPYTTPLFLFFSMPNGMQHARIAVTVSKKIDKRATVRNRIRRQVFHCLSKPEVLTKGYDMLVVAKAGIKNASDTCEIVEKTLSAVHIL